MMLKFGDVELQVYERNTSSGIGDVESIKNDLDGQIVETHN